MPKMNKRVHARRCRSASEMTYIVSSGALNSTHSLTRRCRHSRCVRLVYDNRFA